MDLRRAWPYAAGSYGDLAFEVGDDRRSLRVNARRGPGRCFAVTGRYAHRRGGAGPGGHPGDVLGHDPGPPRRRIRCRRGRAGSRRESRWRRRSGAGRGAGAEGRAARSLRHGVRGADAMLARGFAWSRQRGDEALVGVPGVGRAVLSACAAAGARTRGASARRPAPLPPRSSSPAIAIPPASCSSSWRRRSIRKVEYRRSSRSAGLPRRPMRRARRRSWTWPSGWWRGPLRSTPSAG